MILPLKEENRLKLIGDERIVLKVNDSYIEEGVTYKGNDVTNQVVIKSDIDTNQVGTYQVHYTYQTEKGKTMTMIREVKVTE